MISLHNVVKSYCAGENTVHALKGLNLTLPDKGLVSILGASGCGKTTLLNIIGGLDRPTSGELVVNGVSTSSFKSSDWNAYRNNSVGFVFQNYYLIPHLNVLENVKIAMSLSGLKPKEQKAKAVAALERVGLGDQLHKKPRQLSGGQAQRVAIARATANKPSIILADEPTGALDSENSVQILELLKELSSEILVIIVTHNAELADKYSDRIIKMKDGEVIDDELRTAEFPVSEFLTSQSDGGSVSVSSSKPDSLPKKKKRRTMGLFAAFGTSLKNLYYKLGRTAITSIAGCIGVVSIALILGLNAGFSSYATEYQRSSLSKYPITVAKTSSSLEDLAKLFQEVNGDYSEFDTNAVINILRDEISDLDKFTDEQKIFVEKMITGLGANIDELLKENDTTEFKKYVDRNFNAENATVKFDYDLLLNVYSFSKSDEGAITDYSQIVPLSERTGKDLEYLNSVLQIIGLKLSSNDIQNIRSALSNISFWDSLVDDEQVLNDQYELLTGRWPQDEPENNVFEVVLLVDEYNRLTDASLYALGYISFADMLSAFLANSTEILSKLTGSDFSGLLGTLGKDLDPEYDFNEFIGHEFKLLLETDYFVKNETTGLYENNSDNSLFVKNKLSSAPTLRVSGIIRLRQGVDSGCLNGDIGYSQALVDYIIDNTLASPVVSEQQSAYELYNSQIQSEDYLKYLEILKAIAEEEKTFDTLTEEEKRIFFWAQSSVSLKCVVDGYSLADISNYDTLMLDLGVKDKDSPEAILFYPSSIEAVDEIESFIDGYNAEMKAAHDSGETFINNSVKYTNELESIMNDLTGVIDTITYILIAVTCLAVIVSLFMVGIIMYISVQDRTKEIGILRSMGARKLDIMNIFNTETILLGLLSGIIGVAIGYALTPVANTLLNNYLGISHLIQPVWWHSLIIILASVVLTCISGLLPALFAAKKDPVTALRTE